MDEIAEEIERFNGLIDEETAKLLVMEKKGLLKKKKIVEIKEGTASLFAKIESIGKKRKNFVNVVIGDETGHCIMKLWNHQMKNLIFLKEGDVIRIANAWAKKGIYGLEINVGKYGLIEKVDKKIETKLEFGKKDGIFNLSGKLIKKYPTEVYFENEEKFIRKILVDDNEIFLFDEKVKDVQNVMEGQKIALLWLYSKNGRIYATDFSKITFL